MLILIWSSLSGCGARGWWGWRKKEEKGGWEKGKEKGGGKQQKPMNVKLSNLKNIKNFKNYQSINVHNSSQLSKILLTKYVHVAYNRLHYFSFLVQFSDNSFTISMLIPNSWINIQNNAEHANIYFKSIRIFLQCFGWQSSKAFCNALNENVDTNFLSYQHLCFPAFCRVIWRSNLQS